MQRSTERILTTHTGSLPRPDHLVEILEAHDQHDVRQAPGFSAEVREAVADIARKQVAAGITVVNDGEMSKVGYATYVTERLTGFDGPSRTGITLVEALNHALGDIPSDRVRLHLCWGNYEGPHVRDIPLARIFDVVVKAHTDAFSFEGANPRHEHEWKFFQDAKLPEGKILIPGILYSTTNFVEHPELVAERIVRYAKLVGRENVIAGTDCGFSTFARSALKVHPTVTWAKFQALAEGAQLASEQLWS